MTHISLNPHFKSLPAYVQKIEKFVFLDKKQRYLIAKRRYLEETIAFSTDEELKNELKDELQEVEEELRFVQEQIPEGVVENLGLVIEAYMKLYRLTPKELAKQSGVSKRTVNHALKNDFATEEGKRFAIWVIRTFRLDANVYLPIFVPHAK